MVKVQPGEADIVIQSNAKEFDKFDGVVQPNTRDKYKRYDPDGKVEGEVKMMKVFPWVFFREKKNVKRSKSNANGWH